MNILLRSVLRAFQANTHENHSIMLFPKKHKRKYHHVAGHCRLFCKGHFSYSLWLRQLCPPLHGERSFLQAEIPVFSRVEDKKKTLHKLR